MKIVFKESPLANGNKEIKFPGKDYAPAFADDCLWVKEKATGRMAVIVPLRNILAMVEDE